MAILPILPFIKDARCTQSSVFGLFITESEVFDVYALLPPIISNRDPCWTESTATVGGGCERRKSRKRMSRERRAGSGRSNGFQMFCYYNRKFDFSCSHLSCLPRLQQKQRDTGKGEYPSCLV